MRTTRLRLIPAAVLVAVLGLAVLWLFFKQPRQEAAGAGAGVSQRPAAVAERARPEVRAGREFKLEEFMGFDPELAPWLSGTRGGGLAAGRPPAQSLQPPGQVASLPRGRGGDTR